MTLTNSRAMRSTGTSTADEIHRRSARSEASLTKRDRVEVRSRFDAPGPLGLPSLCASWRWLSRGRTADARSCGTLAERRA